MESRFDKYKAEGKITSAHIANINNLVDWLNKDANNLIEKEIQDLTQRIDNGNAPAIFAKKVDLLIKLGQCIEEVHETYHFNKAKLD